MQSNSPVNPNPSESEHSQQLQRVEEFFLAPKGDRLIRVSISRNTLIAIICSILFHVLMMFLVIPKIEFSPPPVEPTTMVVSLAPPPTPEPVVEPIPEPEPVKEPVQQSAPKVITQKPKPNAPPPVFKVPEEMASPKPVPETPKPQPIPQEPSYPDMASYVKAQQAKRMSADSDAARQNAEAVARELGPTEAEKRDQIISKNLTGGAGGTFTLTDRTSRRISYSFNGWVNSMSNHKQQFFEVEAKSGQDVRVLMIRQIISFIRDSYQGDFPWDSKRLGRVVNLSARIEDTAGLEDFLMTEFFGSNYRTQF